ncbi:Ground-like domain-containing protein [Caenorhabditis elegans]|uniref:Ground-like domain-containing protein n=1 Tax=Caenorhabditis elegans TaxID=6239 RepID=O16301_CAEEL|nr:Ground-like domain-containing protein [Caenorhabditis elegans]CCD65537.1 Ground-like domain-containing protein [Caenorhabditis elegans]|eukprot:NP_872225.3 GRound-Like (grd related) [Caenorhabditis elegans]
MAKYLFFYLSLVLYFHETTAIFFPQLGFGSMNCQCQNSCSSPPAQLGCLCPPPMPCYQQPTQNYYTQPPSVIYPSYQNQQPLQPSSSYLANIPPFMQSYPQPPLFTTPPPLPQDNSILNYPTPSQTFIPQQTLKTSYSTSFGSLGPPAPSAEKLNLQPPALKQKEETSDQQVNEKNYVFGAHQPLSDIFYETGASEADNEIDQNYSPIITTTEAVYRPIETTAKRNYETSTHRTSSSSRATKQESRRYETELMRGEGNSDISSSGYGFESASTTSAPILLEFLEQPTKYENRSPNNTELADVTAFTQEVDEFYKSSTSSPAQTFEYGAVRDARDSTGKDETSTPKFPFDRDENVNKWTSKRKIREKEEINSKCNNPILKDLMEMKMTTSPSISKQMIYSAATEMWMGRNVNVICSKHSFSYVVVTSPIFCEHRKKALTCFVFFQP